jgi:pantothenate kinase
VTDLDTLAARVVARHDRVGGRVLIGIAGSPASGKTTLAVALAARLNAAGRSAAAVPMDGYHLADVELERLGRRNFKGAPDTFDGWGYLSLLRRLRAADEPVVYAPAFDRVIEQPVAGSVPVPQTLQIVVTEGNYLLVDEEPWSRIPGVLDEVWFCRAPEELRRARLLARHVAFGKAPDVALAWIESNDEPNARLVADTAPRADLLVEVD